MLNRFHHSRLYPPDWLLILLLIAGVYLWQRTVFPAWMIDLFPNQFAAYCLVNHHEELVYTGLVGINEWKADADSLARTVGLDCDLSPYMYAPFVAAVLSPFADLPATHWRNTMLAINTGLIAVFAWLILRLANASRDFRGYLWTTVLLLVCYPLARATKLGQIVPLLAVLFWIGLLLLTRGREILAGMLLGIVGAIKLFPIAMIPLLILEKKIVAAISATLTIILIYSLSIASLGIELHRRWWETISEFGSIVIPYFGNQSLPAWIARIGFGQGMDDTVAVDEPAFQMIRFLITGVVAVITLGVLWKSRLSSSQNAFYFKTALLLSGILLTTATSWEHYWLFVLPVLGIAIREVWYGLNDANWEWLLALAVFFFTMKLTRFYGDNPFGRFVSGSQCWGLLFFWIWLVRRVIRPETRKIAAV